MTEDKTSNATDWIAAMIVMGSCLIGSLGLCNLIGGRDRYGKSYNYDGQIGKEHINFEQTEKGFGYPGAPGSYRLKVMREDGRILEYFDEHRGNHKIEHMQIINNGLTNRVYNNIEGTAALQIGQKQFELYLEKIQEIKANKIKTEESIEKQNLEKRINYNIELLK